MPKERTVNPAQAQRKAEKAKAIKKSKANLVAVRNEKLAKKNPDRLQRQLDELKAIETAGGSLTSHEKRMLEELSKEVQAVRKARASLGSHVPAQPGAKSSQSEKGEHAVREEGVLGKRRRQRVSSDQESDDASDVPDDVRAIPMPRDTPPPIPKQALDEFYARQRERHGVNVNRMPLGQRQGRGMPDKALDLEATSHVAEAARTVYESAPVIRDLRKEAVNAFVPAAVKAKMAKMKGIGALVEPEEADRLESEGYGGSSDPKRRAGLEPDVAQRSTSPKNAAMEEVEDEDG